MNSARTIFTTVAAALILTPALCAQAAPNVKMTQLPPQATPRVELFLGYSYLRAVPTYVTGNRLVALNGGRASVAFNVNRYLGIVGDVGGYADTELDLTGPGVPNPRVVSSGGKVFTYLAGPRFSKRVERFTPFVQVLGGMIHASPVIIDPKICVGFSCTPLPSQNAFALTAGGGLDLTLTRHFAVRFLQAEYLMTRFADPTSQVKRIQNDMRLSTGLVIRFGG